MNLLNRVILIIGITCLLSSCRSITQFGFQGAITVQVSQYSEEVRNNSKEQLLLFVKSIGLSETNYNQHSENEYNLDYIQFRKSEKGRTYFINLYTKDSNQFNIIIRDTAREYPKSKKLKEDLEGLLDVLKVYFDESEIDFEIQSTFLS